MIIGTLLKRSDVHEQEEGRSGDQTDPNRPLPYWADRSWAPDRPCFGRSS